MMPLILASSSPRRSEMLTRVGIDIEIVPADVDESPLAAEAALAYVARVAASKADTVCARYPDRWVLAADTIVEVDGEILGKAVDGPAARAMLMRLSGHSHRVSTGFAVRGPRHIDRIVTTEVVMRALSAAELDGYIASDEWHGKAGAYAIQGMAAAMVTAIRGSVTNVAGLPLAEVVEVLANLGVIEPDYRRGVAA